VVAPDLLYFLLVIMGTKNNPKNRAKGVKKKTYFDKSKNLEIETNAVYYYGVHAGHGKYMAAKNSSSGDLIIDESGKPIPFDQI
jgi:hypothetical protein|tara:strand:- start:805 stop:1056 length:252 start_codon:yes stop_codon:yes gene_type:complete